eukprot:g5606.t1
MSTKIEHFGPLAPTKRERCIPIVPRRRARAWPLKDESVLAIWPDEDFFIRSGGIASRNSMWRLWMHYCKRFYPEAYFEPDKYKTREQARWLREKHPNVTWSELQEFGVYLIDCDYKNPQALSP